MRRWTYFQKMAFGQCSSTDTAMPTSRTQAGVSLLATTQGVFIARHRITIATTSSLLAAAYVAAFFFRAGSVPW